MKRRRRGLAAPSQVTFTMDTLAVPLFTPVGSVWLRATVKADGPDVDAVPIPNFTSNDLRRAVTPWLLLPPSRV